MKKSSLFKITFNIWSFLLLTGLVMLLYKGSTAQTYSYTDSWGKAGYTLISQTSTKVVVNYSLEGFSLSDIDVKGESMKNIELPGHFLPNDEGAPNLPGSGRYLTIPQGSTASV
ncbi:MAG: hypothetical protein FJY07_10485, partial [Bacteroidetes bacterium]|nr:hypothetical protein [Bacteroidota bacterium]